MFEIDKKGKSISELPDISFSELDIRERDDLQEWLANTPDALGEPLLIIQKEFAGWEGTRERLDLLAIDEQGALVVIENKLDDTGRDVVWQALKYAAYCSTLTKDEIVEIFQEYLSEQDSQDEASDRICEFLEVGRIDTAKINVPPTPRCILVANNFRIEVTSTVLWLRKNAIDIKCMKATPYKLNKNLLLDITQIIPTPEAEDYMVRLASKEKEEEEIRKRNADGINYWDVRGPFWEQLLDYFDSKNYKLYENINREILGYAHLLTGAGVSGCQYKLAFLEKEARVELVMSGSKEDNKKVFDYLYKRKKEIEKVFGNELEWIKTNEREESERSKRSKISFAKEFDGWNEDNWPEMNEWLYENMRRLEKAIKPQLPGIRNIK